MPTAIDLLHELIAGPDLRGASCVAHRDIFDATAERGAHRAYAAAIRICVGCPVLQRCGAHWDSLPPRKRPFGVTAARIRQARC